MGARFGSPTSRFGSGTLEEFTRAYDKSKRDGGATKIMMYFKNISLPLNEIDIDQIKNIQNFKKSLGPKGGLYQDYDKSIDFKDLVRNHLNLLLPRLVNEYKKQGLRAEEGKKKEGEDTIGDIILHGPREIEEIEEIGYLDSLIDVKNYFSKIKDSAERIALYMTDMSNNLNKGTERINKIKNLPETARIREARKIIDKTADYIMMFVNKTDMEIPVYRDAVTKGFNAYSNVYVKYRSFTSDSEEILELETSKNILREAVNSSLTSLTDLKEVVVHLPAMTSKLAKANKENLRTLNELISEFELSISLLDEIDNNE